MKNPQLQSSNQFLCAHSLTHTIQQLTSQVQATTLTALNVALPNTNKLHQSPFTSSLCNAVHHPKGLKSVSLL
uniref:Uncharacterized protein n=1 Tax=Gossypium raimondii TaxID=29730 RepID=A0A0D2RQF4_GOSRA|nr:hypothetical protein B456_004G056200 [Gossypium raimondii]